jgi:hypothetical protein
MLCYSYLAWCQVLEAKEGNFTSRLNFIIVSWVGKGEWQHALLLQVCLMNAGKGFDNNGTSTQVTGFQCSVLPTAALAYKLQEFNVTKVQKSTKS